MKKAALTLPEIMLIAGTRVIGDCEPSLTVKSEEALMTYDTDYGPYRGHPMDPRTPEPRSYEELTSRKKREAYLRENYTETDLIEALLDLQESCEAFWGAVFLRVKDPELLERLRDRAVYYGIIQP